MGDRPWQQQLQPHDQQAASCSVTAGMMMQASATSSSIHGNNIIRKDPGGGYDMAELDHIFLYLNSQDQASAAIQEQPQTLNIFPSQPMHAGEPSPKGSSSMAAINSAPSNNALAIAAGSSKRPPAAAAAGLAGGSSRPCRRQGLHSKSGDKQDQTVPAGTGVGAKIKNSEAAWFDGEYARWVESHERMMAHMRAAVEEQPQHGGVAAAAAEAQLRQLVDAAVAHHGVLVELKAAVASADVFHLVSGTWLPAAERCFLWIGGFRPSELIKMMARHAEPLTEQQAAGVYGVQQSAREREEALDRDLHATHHALSDAVSSDSLLLFPPGTGATAYSDADALRLQTLYKLPQILTARQSARCFLAIADHSHRLRALTSLWLSRPRHPDQPAPPPPPPPSINPRN
uniref:DOG1 domain-containing protein n=1 Tax=Oryza rufipogon TaxID=4529 RepID=A0A0E0NB53_ORYRU